MHSHKDLFISLSQRFTQCHQDLLIVTKIYSLSPRLTQCHQDLLFVTKIYSLSLKFTHCHQNLLTITKIYSPSPIFNHHHQDLLTITKIYSNDHQDLFIYLFLFTQDSTQITDTCTYKPVMLASTLD